MNDRAKNLWDKLPNLPTGEEFTTLLDCQNIVIERIVSSDKPENTIYHQPQDEWVIVIEGSAELMVDNDLISLKKGDYFFIPAHTSHRVVKTSQNCLWLAVHIYSSARAKS